MQPTPRKRRRWLSCARLLQPPMRGTSSMSPASRPRAFPRSSTSRSPTVTGGACRERKSCFTSLLTVDITAGTWARCSSPSPWLRRATSTPSSCTKSSLTEGRPESHECCGDERNFRGHHRDARGLRRRLEPPRRRCPDVVHDGRLCLRGVCGPGKLRRTACRASRGAGCVRGGLGYLSGCPMERRAPLRLWRQGRIGMDLHGNARGWHAGRGQWLRPVRLSWRQDRAEEFLPQEPSAAREPLVS